MLRNRIRPDAGGLVQRFPMVALPNARVVALRGAPVSSDRSSGGKAELDVSCTPSSCWSRRARAGAAAVDDVEHQLFGVPRRRR